MWKMWGVLMQPSEGEPKIYGIYTTLNQAMKSIMGTDFSYDYTFAEQNDMIVVKAVAKFVPDTQIMFYIKEYQIDV
jgi:hypothetical protein